MCFFRCWATVSMFFLCADAFFCGDCRFRNPDVENSYRVWLVQWLLVLYPVSTTQYPVPRVATMVSQYYSTTLGKAQHSTLYHMHYVLQYASLYSSTTPCCSCYCFLVVISMTTPALVALCSSLFAFLSSLLQLLLQLLQSSPSKEKTAQQRPRQLVNRVDTSHLRGSCALM